jgi:hypothetical protein
MYGCAGWEFVMTARLVFGADVRLQWLMTVGRGTENTVDGFCCRC